jgi:hypothetical protein
MNAKAKTKPKTDVDKIVPAEYPKYVLNFISSDEVEGIPSSAEMPTGVKGTPQARATEVAIEEAARTVVAQKASQVIHVHGSHTLSVRAAGRDVDVFISHHNEKSDALPTINVVLRAR